MASTPSRLTRSSAQTSMTSKRPCRRLGRLEVRTGAQPCLPGGGLRAVTGPGFEP
jgi:hypothetical protein